MFFLSVGKPHLSLPCTVTMTLCTNPAVRVSEDNPFKRARTHGHLPVAEKRSTISDQTFHMRLFLCLFLFQQESKHLYFWCLLFGLHLTLSVNNNSILEKLPVCGSKDCCCFHLKLFKILVS